MIEEGVTRKHPIGGAMDIATYVSRSRNVGLVTTAFSVQNAEVGHMRECFTTDAARRFSITFLALKTFQTFRTVTVIIAIP